MLFQSFCFVFRVFKIFCRISFASISWDRKFIGICFFFRPFSKILFTFTAFSAGSCERVGVSGGKQCANSSHDLQLFRMKISNISTLEKNGGTKNQKTTKGHKHFWIFSYTDGRLSKRGKAQNEKCWTLIFRRSRNCGNSDRLLKT